MAQERDRIPSNLGQLTQALKLAKDTCSIPPAQAAFTSTSVLLTRISVCSDLPFLNHELPTHDCPGHHDPQTGLRRPWALLRRCMPDARAGLEREAIERTQSVRAWSGRETDYVSQTSGAYAG